MADSQIYRFLWSVCMVAFLLPHFSSGLLSDYKICGDSECESLMSRAQAIRDHRGKDCRYLSFRRGDTISVYHKLTGKREDLWAGSIDKQFGYFPKDAVREEHLYATVERVLETQKSDFFCMDENGYPIDSSHLDSDEVEDDDGVQNQELETTQTVPNLDDKNTASPSTTEVISTETQSSTDDTQEELDKNSNTDAAAGTQEEAQQDPAASKEQGGSASSPWLGSTVTGWLGLTKEEESADVDEGEKKDEGEETQAGASSLAASFTGWLGMGEGEGDSGDGVGSGKEEEEAESFSSSVTGWFGFGGEQKTENGADKEDVQEKREEQEEQELTETFRSRRMSLDLEGSQLQHKEEETGTLGWLGNGLSSTLGFGQSNQETTEKEPEKTVKEEESGSWYDMGMGTIFGYNKDTSEESSSQEADADKTVDEPTGKESVAADQSHPAQAEDLTNKTNDESKVEVTPQDGNIPTETEIVPNTAEPVIIEGEGDDEGSSERSGESEKASLKPDHFAQTEDKGEYKEKFSGEDKTDENVPHLGTADLEGENDLTSEATENEGDDSEKREIKTADESDENILSQLDIKNTSDFSSSDFLSDSAGPSVVSFEENLVQESTKIQSLTYDDHKNDMNIQETDELQREISEADGSVEQSQIDAENSSEEIHEPESNSNESETLSHLENTSLQDSVSSDKQEQVNQGEKDAQEQREAVQGSQKDKENSLHKTTVDTKLETEEDKESEKDMEMEELGEEEEEVKRREIEAQDKEREVKEEEKRKAVSETTEKEELLESEELKEEEEKMITGEKEALELEELEEETTQELGRSEDEVEEKQHLEGVEEVKQEEVEELKEGEHTGLKEVKKEDEKEMRDQVLSLHVEQEMENNDRTETDTETSNQSENSLLDVELKEEGNINGEQVDGIEGVEEKVKDEKRDGGEESEDLKDRDETDSTEEEMTETEKPHSISDVTEGSQAASSENKGDEDKTQEERVREGERHEDAETDERNEESGVSDDNISHAVGVDQTEEIEYTNNDVPRVAEDIQGGLSLSEVSSEVEDNDQVKDTELIDDKENYQGDETDVENSSSEEKTEQAHDGYMREKEELNMTYDNDSVSKDADVMVTMSYNNISGTEITTEGDVLTSEAFENQAVVSEQTVPQHSAASSLPPQGPDNGGAKAEGGSAFGLFQNAFNFFDQTPVIKSEESTESPESMDSYTHETPDVQAPPTPDTPADSTQSHVQDLHSDTPIPLSEQQLHLSPSPTQIPESYPTTASPNRESPLHMKTPYKRYQNLYTFLSADDAVMLGDLFGHHKLQFLDDILGSQETMTGDPDTDESILLDIEILLHHHREMLTTPQVKLTDAPQEDKQKTKMLIALQKLEMLLAKVRETFRSNTKHQAESSCVGEFCSTSSEDKAAAEGKTHKVVDSSVDVENNTPRDEWMGLDDKNDGKLRGDADEQSVTEDFFQPQPSQTLGGLLPQILDFVRTMAEETSIHVYAARELLIWLTAQVVSALPDDIRPGPDLYGVPWEPVVFSSLLGLVIMLLFTCRCYSSVKSRLYCSKERWMAGQVAQLLDEKCKVLETLSKCQQEYDDLETSLTDRGILTQTQKTEQMEVKARQLGQDKKELERDLKHLKDQADQQREHRKEQERRIALLEESMKTCEEETKDLQSQEEQAQTTLKVYNMNSERLQRNLETAGEENNLLQESNAQLRQQVEGWAERVSELEAEISRCEASHSGMLQDVANKDERILSLTDRLLRMKAWDSDLKEEGGEEEEKETTNGTAMKGNENGKGDKTDSQGHLQKVQKLIYAAKLNADLKSVDEDKDRAFAKLNDEIKAKEDLQVSIKEMENEKLSLHSETENYSEQVQKLQQKLHIMTEMYQDNELKLHRLLTVEEKERMQKEERLNKADKNIALALEELNNYRHRAAEMEEELEKTKQSYQTQISAHEKKAHNNWLAARAAERDLSDIRRENALLRQKLTDTQFKLDTLDKDPYALDSLARPLPFRAERSPYGPSPLGRPASETRPFLSPPTLMDGPPARLSPRVPRGPMDHLGGPGEMERIGGPHSDSGSISPSWERDRRGPPPGPPGPSGPQGYMFPESGPIYRRPLPPPGAMGPLPPGPFPPGPLPPRSLPPGSFHSADMTDGSFRENSFGPGEQDHRESGPADRRTSPETDPRIGGPPPPGPPMGPMDGPFPRRPPFGPPPPDFYPPRGLGGPPVRPMWAPPPPGMMLPPRFPPGGPLPPHPHQAPPMRHPFPDGLPPPSMGPPPPRQALPSPPHSQSPEEHTPSPEDAI